MQSPSNPLRVALSIRIPDVAQAARAGLLDSRPSLREQIARLRWPRERGRNTRRRRLPSTWCPKDRRLRSTPGSPATMQFACRGFVPSCGSTIRLSRDRSTMRWEQTSSDTTDAGIVPNSPTEGSTCSENRSNASICFVILSGARSDRRHPATGYNLPWLREKALFLAAAAPCSSG